MRHRELTILRHHIAAEIARSEHMEHGLRFALIKPEWLLAEFDYFEDSVFDVLEDLEEVGEFTTFMHPDHRGCIAVARGRL